MADNPTFYLSLFSGAAGLDLAVRIAVPDARCVGFVEREIPAVAQLAARMEDGSMDEAPVWSDVRSVPCDIFRGRVDGIAGGFPCQDLSVAGKREGIGGKRSGLFEEFARLIGDIDPDWAFLENVGGLASSLTLFHRRDIMEHLDGLLGAAESAPTPKDRWYIERHRERLHGRLLKQHGIPALLYVFCRLEAMGYRCEAGFFTAAEVGAPHKRERVFILAHRLADAGDGFVSLTGWRPEGRNGAGSAGTGALGHADEPRPQGRGLHGCRCADERAARAAGTAGVADAERESYGPEHERDSGKRTHRGTDHRPMPRIGGLDLPLFPPGPGDAAEWQRILEQWPHLAPAIKPGLRVLADGLAMVVDEARTDQLRGAGNGVVALEGALALTLLTRRAGIDLGD